MKPILKDDDNNNKKQKHKNCTFEMQASKIRDRVEVSEGESD